MSYEKFNDAMCRLRQAEEDFNKALQDAYAAINEAYLKDSSTDLQVQIDEAYNKGLQDLYEALRIIAAEDGMPVSELNNAFGIRSVCNIILGFTSEEIIDKVNRWKAEKEKEEQEFHVGDEVLTNGTIGIIIDVGDNDGIVWITYRITPEARGLDFCWVSKIKCKKTGRHFDSIPFDYNPEKEKVYDLFEEVNK